MSTDQILDDKELILYHCRSVLKTTDKNKVLRYARERKFLSAAGEPTVIGKNVVGGMLANPVGFNPANIVRSRFREILVGN